MAGFKQKVCISFILCNFHGVRDSLVVFDVYLCHFRATQMTDFDHATKVKRSPERRISQAVSFL